MVINQSSKVARLFVHAPMNQEGPPTNLITQAFLLVILGALLIFAVRTLRGVISGQQAIGQEMPTDPTGSASSDLAETYTAEAITTWKASDHATYMATTRTPITPIYLPTGIHNTQRTEISAALLFIDAQNGWGGFDDGYYFSLYAGSLQSDPDQGVIGLVMDGLHGTSIENFTTPTKHGALSVVTQQDHRMMLVSVDGTTFYFDLQTHQFEEAASTTTPGVTPSPPVTPEPTGLPYPLPTEAATAEP